MPERVGDPFRYVANPSPTTEQERHRPVRAPNDWVKVSFFSLREKHKKLRFYIFVQVRFEKKVSKAEENMKM